MVICGRRCLHEMMVDEFRAELLQEVVRERDQLHQQVCPACRRRLLKVNIGGQRRTGT